MAQPISLTLNGSIQAAPSASTSLVPSLALTVLLSISKAYSYKTDGSISINSPVTPVVLGLGSIAKVRFMFVRVIGASVLFELTSAAGASQLLKVSDEMIWHSPNEGDQITAISMVGVSDLEFVLLGD